jgi:hypothetical protein
LLRKLPGQQATGNRQQATGNRQQATGNRQQATGNRQHYTHLLSNSVNYTTVFFLNFFLKHIIVVRKLQFLNNFLKKSHFCRADFEKVKARKNARLVREPTGFPNKSIIFSFLFFVQALACFFITALKGG